MWISFHVGRPIDSLLSHLRRLKSPKFFKNSSPSNAGVKIEDSHSTQSWEAWSSSLIALMPSTIIPTDSKFYYPQLTVQQSWFKFQKYLWRGFWKFLGWSIFFVYVRLEKSEVSREVFDFRFLVDIFRMYCLYTVCSMFTFFKNHLLKKHILK